MKQTLSKNEKNAAYTLMRLSTGALPVSYRNQNGSYFNGIRSNNGNTFFHRNNSLMKLPKTLEYKGNGKLPKKHWKFV